MDFLGEPLTADNWSHADSREIADRLVLFLNTERHLGMLSGAFLEFRKAVKDISSDELFRLLHYLSKEEGDLHIRLVPFLDIVEDEIVSRNNPPMNSYLSTSF